MMTDRTFPERFLWGAATSAYQIEGEPLADSAGASIWHRFAHNPGRIANGDTGDIACDHYRRFEQDVDLMADLGLKSYRFSISWPRVLPEGRGIINTLGLDFYQRLVDRLVERGIQPMATLYHWDLPAALSDRGGWLNPDSPAWLADYARVVFEALDDRVTHWITLNEPWIVAVQGYLEGRMAPGHRDRFEAPRVAHQLLLAHAQAVGTYRSVGRHQIGIAVNLEPQHPATGSAEDKAAAARRDQFTNRWFLDPIFKASYPSELPDIFGAAWPRFPDYDLERIKTPIDFLGVNYYSRGLVRAEPGAPPLGAVQERMQGAPRTAMDWEIYPQGLIEVLLALKERYGNPPIYITENGAAFDDPEPVDGLIQDPERIGYIRSHLRAARRAITAGADLRGYFVWSLLDNFEWTHGYAKRFGLYGIERPGLRRIPKESAQFYREVIRSNGGSLGG